MKVVLRLSLVFLCTLITIDKIAAKPVDEPEPNLLTTVTGETDPNVSTDLTTPEGDTTSYPATTADTDSTTVSWTDITIGNDTLDGNATQSNATEEATTPLTTSQPEPSGRVNLQVVVSPATLQVQRGQTYELICYVYGADANTNIYWIQEEPERRYALTDTEDKHVAESQVSSRVRMTLDDPSKIGRYTCMAQDTAGNSGSGTLTMQEDNYHYRPPSPAAPDDHYSYQYLSIVAPDMADGDYVELQCEGAAPEDQGSIQWYFNNRLLHDEQPLFPRGRTLHIRPISTPYLGNYRCSIPGHRYGDANTVITFQKQPSYPAQPVFTPTGPLTIDEGGSQVIQPPAGYYRVYWTRSDGQGLPSGIYQSGNDLQITNAQADHSGTYYCELYNADGTSTTLPYEIHVRRSQAYHPPSNVLPQISIRPQTINLKEGQRMIVQYTIVADGPMEVIWTKHTEQGYQPLPSAFTVEPNRLILQRATPDVAGVYQITVRNPHGEVREELRVNVEASHHEHVRDPYQPQRPVRVTVHPSELTVVPGDKGKLTCYVQGNEQYRVTWSRHGHDTNLPDYARQQGNSVIITPPADARGEHIYLQCQVEVPGQTQTQLAYAPVTIHGGRRKRRNIWRKRLITHVKN